MAEQRETPKRGPDPTIVAAIIGVAGTIIVTLISVYANRQPPPTPTITPIVVTATSMPTSALPTDTPLPQEPTLTSLPPTDTPAPTETFTPVPPVALGADWPQGCISTLWRAYPAEIVPTDKGNGCWQEPVGKFTADGGGLFIAGNRAQRGTPDLEGLFALMPESGEVTFKVRLRKANGVDFIAGIFTDANLESPAFVLSIPGDGNVSKLRIVQKDNLAGYNTITGTALLDQGDGYSITFNFSEANIGAKVNPFVFVFDSIPIPSLQKWLFIGYKSGEGAYEVDVIVSNFTVK
ncbi:MAG: hypothetical protein HXY42_02655 [Chloroflexi bacterium]|nr:hypothetical protein [Chloroflexota bacterium]